MIVYQIFTRLFSNRNLTRKEWGTIEENGCGKMNDFDGRVLRHIRELGVTHVWYTGLIRHATMTDYSAYGIPRQHARVVKGRAGSPYAIADYYDIDPDLATDVDKRLDEFSALVKRTHHAGLKFLMDFVPNHVAREYKSIMKPEGTEDLGEHDDTFFHFHQQNNYYYSWGKPLNLSQVAFPPIVNAAHYTEVPAKATGNDRFDNTPTSNDWYETVKLNYGVDYCDLGGRSYHYEPMPNTWKKMADILLYWAARGIDGFRCDMVFMVPLEFWQYAIARVKEQYPKVIFIAEIYDQGLYRQFVKAGFDYLYDKVGMYDTVRAIICGQKPASSITYEWQATDDLHGHMLYFLENHDEQRIASDFFAGDPRKALPAVTILALLQQNPFMVYAGQEVGERGMDKEGFSGRDGRTTIFDYWAIESINNAYFDRRRMSKDQKQLEESYKKVLNIASNNHVALKGEKFDLMYVNGLSEHFNPRFQYAFMRKHEDDVLLIVANFSEHREGVLVKLPEHAFDFYKMVEQDVVATDLLTGEIATFQLKKDGHVGINLEPHSARVFQFTVRPAEKPIVFNEHNKDEFPPAHTAEHLLNQLMMRMFGCGRSKNAHIERRKSKINYTLSQKPTRQQEKEIEEAMNRLIELDLPVSYETVDRYHIPHDVSLDKLPEDASEAIRLVRIGDYDVCPCLGKHVRSTSQIGRFQLLGTNWDEEKHIFRIRFKVVQ